MVTDKELEYNPYLVITVNGDYFAKLEIPKPKDGLVIGGKVILKTPEVIRDFNPGIIVTGTEGKSIPVLKIGTAGDLLD